jgi:hypothetical protein
MKERPRLPWVGSIVVVAFATATLVAAFLAAPAHRQLEVRVYVIVLEVVGARLLVRALVRATWVPGPLRFDLAMRPRVVPAAGRPSEPGQIVNELGAAASRALELHYRLRPRLRAIAADRLAANHGLDLDADPERSRHLLGEDAWDLLSPEREPPEERFGPGPGVEPLARIVGAVEAL